MRSERFAPKNEGGEHRLICKTSNVGVVCNAVPPDSRVLAEKERRYLRDERNSYSSDDNFDNAASFSPSETDSLTSSSDTMEDVHKCHRENLKYGKWRPLKNQPNFVSYDLTDPENPIPAAGGATYPRLLTDGSIIVQNNGVWATPEMWRFVPDIYGNYHRGTWHRIADLPYTPTYYTSAVLADGRVIALGGEYTGFAFDFTLTNEGAIYDPWKDQWTTIFGPDFFVNYYPTWHGNNAVHPIGDGASVVLENGSFMINDKMSTQSAIWDVKKHKYPQWREVGTCTKQYMNSEEGWTLLPDGTVLTIDCYKEYRINHETGADTFPFPFDLTSTEIFDPKTEKWHYGGSTKVSLIDAATTDDAKNGVPNEFEIGPQLLRPDGTVFCVGANGNTAIYDSKKKNWKRGPRLPSLLAPEYQLGSQDGPAVLLTNGDVLFAAGPIKPSYGFPVHFLLFDGHHIHETDNIRNSKVVNPGIFTPDSTFNINLLMLPTGEVFLTDFSNDVEIFTPSDRSFDEDWAPVIEDCPDEVKAGRTYKIEGIRFNGMSQCSVYGDDVQYATNYPLVRITNRRTDHVFYCVTHDHSFMGVASNRRVHTYFDVPEQWVGHHMEHGDSIIEVVANGIASKPRKIRVRD